MTQHAEIPKTCVDDHPPFSADSASREHVQRILAINDGGSKDIRLFGARGSVVESFPRAGWHKGIHGKPRTIGVNQAL